MPTRRRTDDEDDAPRRRDREGGQRPPGRKKRKRKKGNRGMILLLALIGLGLFVVLGVGAVLIVHGSGNRTPSSAGATAGRPTNAPTVGAELVVNGGFEDGAEPDAAGPGFTPMEIGSTAIPGWTVTRGSVDYIGVYWQHAEGRRSIDLNGNEPGAIAQTIRTKPGRSYRVTFRLAGNTCGGGTGVKTVVVTAGAARAEFTFDTAGRTYTDMGWATKTWQFTAAAAETTLEFASATLDAPACGPALDGVSVLELGG